MEAVLHFFIDQFSNLVDISLTASIVILVVIGIRQLLKRTPKVFSYALWGIVLLRLLIPISIESPVSIVPDQTTISNVMEFNEVLPEIEFETPQDRANNEWIRENTPADEPFTQISRVFNAEVYLTIVWLIGMSGMMAASMISFGKLRKRVRVCVPFRKGIYIADDIDTPFVMGIFRPTIYLPGTLDRAERKYIIAHERHHIRRGDHIFKALGFLALTIHWFNPLVWVAFMLANRDMEMSCDEAVIRKFGEDIRADYSASLLNLATGHRLFAGNPLAFGEGNPTDRVRNLAKWKKPAFWMVLICVVLCLVLAICLLTNPETDVPDEIDIVETAPTVATEAEVAPENDWGVSIKPDRVSRTGATALFVYSGSIPGEEGAELTYGDFLSLDRMVDGNWVPCDELAGYEHFVGDASYPVVDGFGMVHDWPYRFGELADGHYRIGKQVTLVRQDGSTESRMVYGEFSIPDSILTGPIPLEDLPEQYGAEQAMIDGCVVMRDGDVSHNQEVWQAFLDTVNAGQQAYVRTAEYHYYPELSQVTHYVYDIHFDGNIYSIEGILNGERFRKEYQYLLTFLGKASNESHDYDSYICYVLSNELYETWEKANGITMDGSIKSERLPQVVYTDLIYGTNRPQLPANPAQAVLEFNGTQLVTTTDFDRLEKIWILFQEAEYLGYEPKTHSVGVGLNLTLTSQSGETMTIELDPDSDICRINGEYVFYGAYDEPDYIEKLWYYLGIPSWPDSVYEKYPNAYRQ